VLTKADKLNRSQAQLALQAAQAVLADVSGESTDIGVTLFSALKKEGVGDVAQAIYDWVHPA
jgi:GTP-binding protein